VAAACAGDGKRVGIFGKASNPVGASFTMGRRATVRPNAVRAQPAA
jgi:hypothetical protein